MSEEKSKVPSASRPNLRRAGSVGAPDIDPREILLRNAGITDEVLAGAVKRSFEKKVDLLEAKVTKFFQHEGEVIDQRECEDNATQLKAAEALDRMAGAIAPPSTKSVEVVYRLEIPEWFRAPEEKDVIDVTPLATLEKAHG